MKTMSRVHFWSSKRITFLGREYHSLRQGREQAEDAGAGWEDELWLE